MRGGSSRRGLSADLVTGGCNNESQGEAMDFHEESFLQGENLPGHRQASQEAGVLEAVANAENGLVTVHIVRAISGVAVFALYEPLLRNSLFETGAETDAVAGAFLVSP